jgi:NAD(P)H-dependent FMN reductase
MKDNNYSELIKLEVIIASTRPGRVGLPVAEWFAGVAKQDERFNVAVADLAEINLPFLDEPNHPRQRQYTKEHTKAWSARIDQADAFVFVTPEYNYSGPASLINALSFLYHEWAYKPAAFVSYGGISGGTRSVQHLKSPITTLRMMPIPEAVNIPFVATHVENGEFEADERNTEAAHTLLKELQRWAEATKRMRAAA